MALRIQLFDPRWAGSTATKPKPPPSRPNLSAHAARELWGDRLRHHTSDREVSKLRGSLLRCLDLGHPSAVEAIFARLEAHPNPNRLPLTLTRAEPEP